MSVGYLFLVFVNFFKMSDRGSRFMLDKTPLRMIAHEENGNAKLTCSDMDKQQEE